MSQWNFETWNEPNNHDFDNVSMSIQGEKRCAGRNRPASSSQAVGAAVGPDLSRDLCTGCCSSLRDVSRLSELLRRLLGGPACCQQPAPIRGSGRLLSFSSPLAVLLGPAAALPQRHQLLHRGKGRPHRLHRSAQEGGRLLENPLLPARLGEPVRRSRAEKSLVKLDLLPAGGRGHPAHPPAGGSDREGDPAAVPWLSPPPRVQRRGRSSGGLVQTSGVEGRRDLRRHGGEGVDAHAAFTHASIVGRLKEEWGGLLVIRTQPDSEGTQKCAKQSCCSPGDPPAPGPAAS